MKRILLLAVTISSFVAAPSRIDADGPDQANSVKVAGLVLRWVRGDKEANFRRLEPMIREAAAKGARIVVTTECSLDGYAVADRKNISDVDWRTLGEPIPSGVYFKKLAALAKELKIFLVAGMTEADGDERYNTVVIIGPDGMLVGKYRKQKLGHEEGRNTPGTLSSVFATPFGKVGVMICADRTDAKIVKRICDNGADFLICPSGGMFGPKTNDPIVQARSKENKIHIVFVHPVEFLATGPDGGILQRELLGNNLLVTKEQRDGKEDERRIYYFQMPVKGPQVEKPPLKPAGQPGTDPLEVAREANRAAALGLKSGKGYGTFEFHEQGANDKKPKLMQKGKFAAGFAGGKYHVRMDFDREPYTTTERQIIVYGGDALLLSKFFLKEIPHPTGSEGYIYALDGGNTRPGALCGFPWDVSKMARHALDLDGVLQRHPREAIKMTAVDGKGYRGTLRINKFVTSTFDVDQASGWNITRLTVQNDGEQRPVQTHEASWKKAGDLWYVSSAVHQVDLRRIDRSLLRWELRYEKFEPNREVPAKLFTQDALELHPRSRILDQRPNGPKVEKKISAIRRRPDERLCQTMQVFNP